MKTYFVDIEKSEESLIDRLHIKKNRTLFVELYIDDVLNLLLKDEQFSKIYNKDIQPLRFEMKAEGKHVLVRVDGLIP